MFGYLALFMVHMVYVDVFRYDCGLLVEEELVPESDEYGLLFFSLGI